MCVRKSLIFRCALTRYTRRIITMCTDYVCCISRCVLYPGFSKSVELQLMTSIPTMLLDDVMRRHTHYPAPFIRLAAIMRMWQGAGAGFLQPHLQRQCTRMHIANAFYCFTAGLTATVRTWRAMQVLACTGHNKALSLALTTCAFLPCGL
jgi:hypothetical protein